MRQPHVRVVQQRVRGVPREQLPEEVSAPRSVPFLEVIESLGALPAQELLVASGGARGWIHAVMYSGRPAGRAWARWRALRSGEEVGARRGGLP